MASVGTYLNFANQTEAAFTFYQSIFGGEFEGGIRRFGDMPPQDGMPPLPEEAKNLVLHVSLPINGGHKLMGSDAPEHMGFVVNKGNNVYITIHEGKKRQVRRMFDAVGLDVKNLKRIRISKLNLPAIPAGSFVEVSKEDILE